MFKIRVTNIGGEPLKNITVTDSIAPNCAGSVTLPGTKPASWSNFAIGGSGNHANNTLEENEYFEYTCTKANTTAAYTNIAATRGVGTVSNTPVTDTDDTRVLLVSPSIQVVKIDANTLDQDGSIGDDSQTLNVGDKAVFKIRVTNDGTEDLKDIVLTDAIGPNCAGSVTLPSTKPATFLTFVTAGSGDHTDAFLQPGEFFEYTCEKANTTVNYTNTIAVTAKGKDSNTSVDDNDPTDVVVAIANYDLALKKVISTTTPGPFNIGDTVTFDIIVTNQGGINANNIEITDYIPTGLTLSDANWTQSGNKATRTIASLLETTSTTLPITFTINSQAQPGNLTNYAEISADDGNDCDSTPDNDNTNDGTPVNDDIGTGCEPNGDEDDHDPEVITITGPSIKVDKLDANTLDQDGSIGDDSQTLNVGDKAVFKIRVTNDGTEDLKDIVLTDAIGPNCAGSVTLPSTKPATFLTFVTAGSGDHTDVFLQPGEFFEYTCEKVNTTANYTNVVAVAAKGKDTNTDVNDNNDTRVLVAGPSCTNLTASPSTGVNSLSSTVVCTGEDVTTFKIDCGNGATFS